MRTSSNLDHLRKIAEAATPGPWEWRYPEDPEGSNIVYYEPYTDGSKGKGSKYDLISRDSGVYGPDVSTCEYIMRFNPALVSKLLDVVAEASEAMEGVSEECALYAGEVQNMNPVGLYNALKALEAYASTTEGF